MSLKKEEKKNDPHYVDWIPFIDLKYLENKIANSDALNVEKAKSNSVKTASPLNLAEAEMSLPDVVIPPCEWTDKL